MPQTDRTARANKVPREIPDEGQMTCMCGAQMSYYTKSNEEGWFCPVCNRKRPVISDHRKPIKR